MSGYSPKHFQLNELIPMDLYNEYSVKRKLEYCLWQFNPLVLKTADLLRERFGSITINNWKVGGPYQQRGLRTDKSVGAALSFHRRGAALDCGFSDVTADEVRAEMKRCGCFEPRFKDTFSEKAACFQYINRVETGTTWFHFDIANCYNDDGSIMMFSA